MIHYQRQRRKAATNTGFASGGVTCKLEALCYYPSVVLVDSFVLRNPPERKARNRYKQAYDDPCNHQADTKTTRLLTSKQTFGRPILC